VPLPLAFRLACLALTVALTACGSSASRGNTSIIQAFVTADADPGPDAVDVPDALTPLDVAPAQDATPAGDATQPLDTTKAPDVPTQPGLRDWTLYPAIVQRPMPTDLWFLGDVHADAKRLGKLMNGAGLASDPASPEQAQWLAGPAVLVVTGDFIDKDTHGLEVIAYLRALQASAQSQGGQVIVTLGNHEAEFLADPTVAKVSEFAGELTDAGLSPQLVAQGQEPIGQWLRGLPVAVKVGPWFACHAGDTHGASLDALDLALRKDMDAHGFAAPVLIADGSLLEQKLDPPWWELGPQAPQPTLASAVQALGAQHVVQGHQPGKVLFADGTKRKSGTVFQKFGLVFLIDAGMSKAVDDSLGALLHVHHDGLGDHATVVTPDGVASALWDGK
jgi:hypothetical protein